MDLYNKALLYKEASMPLFSDMSNVKVSDNPYTNMRVGGVLGGSVGAIAGGIGRGSRGALLGAGIGATATAGSIALREALSRNTDVSEAGKNGIIDGVGYGLMGAGMMGLATKSPLVALASGLGIGGTVGGVSYAGSLLGNKIGDMIRGV